MLDVVSAVFIYRIVVLYKQHVVPMISTVRKLLTCVVNILWFRHVIGAIQWLALLLVAAIVGLEMWLSYK